MKKKSKILLLVILLLSGIAFGKLVQDDIKPWTDSTYNLGSEDLQWLAAYLGFIQFDTSYSNGIAEGKMSWNSDDGTLNLGMPGGSVNLQIGQETIVRVINATGDTIINGTPVYLSGATGTNILIEPADADFDLGLGFRTFGVATEDILGNNGKGYVTMQGFVRDIDTDFAVAAGVPAYLAVGGGFTSTPPTAPDTLYLVGIVTRKSATVGEIFVIQTSVPNLNSLSDVDDSSQDDKDVLQWDSASDTWISKADIDIDGDIDMTGVLTIGSGVEDEPGGVLRVDGDDFVVASVEGCLILNAADDVLLQVDLSLDNHDIFDVDDLTMNGNLKNDGISQFGDGGTTDYAEFEADGTLEFNGTAVVWNDIQTGFSGARVPPAFAPTWTSFVGNLNAYSFDVGEFIEFDPLELLHGYKEGSDFEIHMHWVTNGLDGTDRAVNWEIEYTIANIGNAATTGIGDAFPATTVVAVEQTIPANTPDLTHMYIDLDDITAGTFENGALIAFRIIRIAAVGDDPTSNPFGLQVGVHYMIDTIGSRTEYTK